MNLRHRKILEDLVEEAVEKVADERAWSEWGPSRRARASYAQALLANDALLRLVRATKPAPAPSKPSGVVQEAAPPPVVEKPAASAGDAGSTPAPAVKPVKRKRRRRG